MLSSSAGTHFTRLFWKSAREISWEALLHAAVDRRAARLVLDYYYCWNYRGILEFDHYSKRRYLPVSAPHPRRPLRTFLDALAASPPTAPTPTACWQSRHLRVTHVRTAGRVNTARLIRPATITAGLPNSHARPASCGRLAQLVPSQRGTFLGPACLLHLQRREARSR